MEAIPEMTIDDTLEILSSDDYYVDENSSTEQRIAALTALLLDTREELQDIRTRIETHAADDTRHARSGDATQ